MNIFKTNHSIYKLLKTSLSLSIYKYCIHNVFSSFIYSNLLLNYKSPCKDAWNVQTCVSKGNLYVRVMSLTKYSGFGY